MAHKKIVTLGIGDGVTRQELTRFLNQLLLGSKPYFTYVEDARLKEQIAEMYMNREIVGAGSIVECTKRVTTIEDDEEQWKVVQKHHRGKTNHRGLNEMLASLKREYYWLGMPGTIREVLAMCEVCLQAKYVRQLVTPTTGTPLERVLADAFFYEGKMYVTIMNISWN
jgi:hypothetical protein